MNLKGTFGGFLSFFYLCGGEGSREDKGRLRGLICRALFPAVHADSLARHFGLAIPLLGGRNNIFRRGRLGPSKTE